MNMTTIIVLSAIYLLSALLVWICLRKEEGLILKFWHYFVILCPAVNTIAAACILLGDGDSDMDLPDFDFD